MMKSKMLSLTEMSKKLGITRQAVWAKRIKLGGRQIGRSWVFTVKQSKEENKVKNKINKE